MAWINVLDKCGCSHVYSTRQIQKSTIVHIQQYLTNFNRKHFKWPFVLLRMLQIATLYKSPCWRGWMDSHGKAAHRECDYRENETKLGTARVYLIFNMDEHAEAWQMRNINAPFVDPTWVGFFADSHFSNNLETGIMWLISICLRTSSCKLHRKREDVVIPTWKAETSRPPPIRPIKEFSVELNRDDMTSVDFAFCTACWCQPIFRTTWEANSHPGVLLRVWISRKLHVTILVTILVTPGIEHAEGLCISDGCRHNGLRSADRFASGLRFRILLDTNYSTGRCLEFLIIDNRL